MLVFAFAFNLVVINGFNFVVALVLTLEFAFALFLVFVVVLTFEFVFALFLVSVFVFVLSFLPLLISIFSRIINYIEKIYIID